jgi:hypothetical protein
MRRLVCPRLPNQAGEGDLAQLLDEGRYSLSSSEPQCGHGLVPGNRGSDHQDRIASLCYRHNVQRFFGNTDPVPSICRHDCLRYKRIASFTRLIPLVIPKRRNSRLKCIFTVRRAILSWLAISALSHPCRSSSTTCCSRGPKRTSCSFITPPLYIAAPLPHGRLAFLGVQCRCPQAMMLVRHVYFVNGRLRSGGLFAENRCCTNYAPGLPSGGHECNRCFC